MRSERVMAATNGALPTGALAALIVLGSRNLAHFDAALVGYTFATLFAAFGITYRYAMWLQRPPTAMYWRRGWQVFCSGPAASAATSAPARPAPGRRLRRAIASSGGAARRGGRPLAASCGAASSPSAITFPLVFGWIHFETRARRPASRIASTSSASRPPRSRSIRCSVSSSSTGWSGRRCWSSSASCWRCAPRLRDHGAAALQQFGEDFLPLLLLFAISVTGLMLTASYTWMKGYAYDFLAILHADHGDLHAALAAVRQVLPYLPASGPARRRLLQGRRAAGEQAHCRRCGAAVRLADARRGPDRGRAATRLPLRDRRARGEHYQWICPACRRALLGAAHRARPGARTGSYGAPIGRSSSPTVRMSTCKRPIMATQPVATLD